MTACSRSIRTLLIAVSLSLLPATPAHTQGKWTKLATFPEPAEELLGVAAGGKMYVFCGLAPGWKPIGLVYEYDPASNAWMVLPSMPVARHGLAGAVVGNRLHMVSGNVQSAGTGVQVHSDAHDAFEFAK
jgi:hypothetical protein